MVPFPRRLPHTISPLEEAVTSELVSKPQNSLLAGKKQGIFTVWPCEANQMMPNTGADPMTYEEIPYASEQGIFADVTGN